MHWHLGSLKSAAPSAGHYLLQRLLKLVERPLLAAVTPDFRMLG